MEMEPGKLFIGGISWDTNEDRLKDYFSTFGEVVEAVIMKDRTTGRARGFGFVVFTDPVVAESVVKEKHIIDGRTVEAKKAVPRDDHQMPNRNNGSNQGSPGIVRTKKIFVGGLASTVTESDFKKYFDQFGTITDVVVMYDHNTQRPRGFGFITFESEEAVDKVLLQTFHELNGKMVEVKRAVPKELSPGPIRSQLGGYNYGLSRVSSLLGAYNNGCNSPSSVGGYGVRLDGRFSPVTVGRTGYSPANALGYGIGPNFETGMGLPNFETGMGLPNFETAGQNLISNHSYNNGLNPFQNGSPNSYGSPNRYGNPVGYNINRGGNGSVMHSTNRNTWGDGSLSYAKSPTNSGNFMGSRNGMTSAFGNIGAIWGSSHISDQDGVTSTAFSNDHVNYGSAESSFQLGGGIGSARNTRSSVGPALPYAAANSGSDGAFGNFYGGGSLYVDQPTLRSSSPELEGSGSFAYGLRNAVSDITPGNPVGYVGGYSVRNRSNRGIAA